MTNEKRKAEDQGPPRLVRIHCFESEAEAYDASQTDDRIQDGDVLLASDPRTAAILIRAWPTLVEFGEWPKPGDGGRVTAFDRLKPESRWENVEGGRYLFSLAAARDALLKRGWA